MDVTRCQTLALSSAEATLTEANLETTRDTGAMVVQLTIKIMGVTGLWDVSTLACQRGLTL